VSLGLYFLTLILTLVIELGVAYILGYRNKKELLMFFLVNIVTHPLLSYFLWINSTFFIIPINYLSFILFEIIVVLLETVLLYLGLKGKYLNMLLVSLSTNVASFVLGLLIF
jgi:hypothetical protein